MGIGQLYFGRVCDGAWEGRYRMANSGLGAIRDETIVFAKERDEEGWYFVVMESGRSWWLKEMPEGVEATFRVMFALPPESPGTCEHGHPNVRITVGENCAGCAHRIAREVDTAHATPPSNPITEFGS